MDFMTVLSRTSYTKLDHENEAYIVTIDNFITFKNEFISHTQEKNWKPDAYYIIVFKEFKQTILTDLFQTLLQLHIFHVAILYASKNSPIHTYNPFQNKNCGKMFEEIIQFDNCSQTNIANIYFNKTEKILNGCTFNVAIPDWPPFTTNPKNNGIVKLNGTEQYLMKILGELEGFNLNYTYTENAEDFYVVENMKATGTLGLIQKGKIDITFGGMLLTYKRAFAFSYLYGYHDNEDEILTLVKKAETVPKWKNIYMEFTYIVWILVLITFVIYFIILSTLFRLKDKCYLILIMWDILFLHSHKLRLKFKGECILLQWVIFAFFINTYYQCNLTGLTTHPNYNYQISNSEDLSKFKLQSCVCSFIKTYIKALSPNKHFNDNNKDCDWLLNSVTVVSKDYTKYTVVLRSVYKFHEYKYKNEFGESLLYEFPRPESKIIYVIYFYKGFPCLGKMHLNALRLRENGLIDKRIRDLKYEVSKASTIAIKDYKASFIFPWHVLVIGFILSTVAFVIELIADYIMRRRMHRIIYLE
ncbi:hypothetical protein RR46_04966 [Papilio xuthus]|uniref:Uncharacterized protein n=1 Tax=Papilio xuthus TaxID=66420 RepID=A0A194PTV1_PAPXU|nr:hypothetical protein RR46_04966 [Papilio xuthus]